MSDIFFFFSFHLLKNILPCLEGEKQYLTKQLEPDKTIENMLLL